MAPNIQPVFWKNWPMKRVVHFDLKKDTPDKATLLGALLGPTGNLRAPTLRRGRTLLVGFDEAAYAKVLK